MTLGRSSRIGSKWIIAGLAATFCISAQPPESLAAEEVVHRMHASEGRQKKNLPNYSTVREYRLSNEDGSKVVEILARVRYDSEGRKSIDIIQERGGEGLFRRAVRKVLETEVKTSQGSRAEMQIGPENYEFRAVGTEARDGRLCYVLELAPKRKSKYLIAGKLWVDAQDFAVSRIEGRPTANLSFWVGKPYITQSFQKVGDVWLLARNESTTKAKVVGHVTFTVETREVETAGTKLALQRTPRRLTPFSD